MSKATTDLSLSNISSLNTRLSKNKSNKENLYQRVESLKNKLFKTKIVPLNDKNITQENLVQVDNKSKCECPTMTTETSKSDCHAVTNSEPKLNIHQDFNGSAPPRCLSFSKSTECSRSKLDLHSVDSNSEICRNEAIIKGDSIHNKIRYIVYYRTNSTKFILYL